MRRAAPSVSAAGPESSLAAGHNAQHFAGSTPPARSPSCWTSPLRSVSRCIATGELIAHWFGRSVRIADDDLRAFLARRRGA